MESLISTKAITFDDYVYPPWAQWVAWGIALISIIAIPLGAVHHIISVFLSGDIMRSLKDSLKPTKAWRRNAEMNLALNPDSPVHTINGSRTIINDFYINGNPIIGPTNGVINPAFAEL